MQEEQLIDFSIPKSLLLDVYYPDIDYDTRPVYGQCVFEKELESNAMRVENGQKIVGETAIK